MGNSKYLHKRGFSQDKNMRGKMVFNTTLKNNLSGIYIRSKPEQTDYLKNLLLN